MENNYNFLYKDEITVMKLRRLYESKGFSKFRMSKFESYDFYAKNRDFLVGNRIITFSDLNGKLMALKPDVTLSIVKNADDTVSRRKLYYTENVYRESKDVHEFKEIFQVGLEVLGSIDLFETVEIITLAIKSLLEIDKNAVLELSHMGYVQGLIDSLPCDADASNEIRRLISEKNPHDLMRLADKYNLPDEPIENICEMMQPKPTNDEALLFAQSSAVNSKMSEAAEELKSIYNLLKKSELQNHVKIDLSVTGDPNYYNGVIMHGYVGGIPRDVLSGGRYDMLMEKMCKKQSHAMGFAIYFDALDRILHKKEQASEMSYILYSPDSDEDTLFALAEKLDKENVPYTAVTQLPDGLTGVKAYRIDGKTVKEAVL